MALVDPRTLLRGLVRNHLRTPARMEVDAWCDAYRRVVEPSPRPGRWRTAEMPYMRDILRAFTDPSTRRIVFKSSPQVGKTELQINCFFYSIDQEPYPTLFVLPTATQVREFVGDRLLDQIKATPRIARHLSEKKHDTKKKSIRFDTLTAYFAGANSASELAGKPAGRLYLDERDKYPMRLGGRGLPEAGAVDLAEKRLGSYGSEAKIIETSTPTMENFGIDAEYRKSTKGLYHVPCPFCDRYQVLQFRQIKWHGGSGHGLSDYDLVAMMTRVRREAVYQCEHCQKPIESHMKLSILQRGLWVYEGQEIVVRRGVGPVVVGDVPDIETKGFHLWKAYTPWLDFGETAAEFVKRRGEVDQDFVNGQLGEAWSTPGVRGEESVIVGEAERQRLVILQQSAAGGEAAASVSGAQFRKGEVPSDALIVLTGADVQKDGVYVVTVGIGEREAWHLVDWRFIPCPEIPEDSPDEDVMERWRYVTEYFQRSWPRALTGEAVRAHTVVIDSAHRTKQVYTICEQLGPWVTPVRGELTLMQPITWGRVSVRGLDVRQRGQRAAVSQGADGLDLMHVNTTYWKNELLTRMHRKPPQAGALRYPLDFLDAAVDGDDLARQLTAEERVRAKSGRRVIDVWQLRPGRKDNHYLDIVVYLLAMAEHLAVPEMTRQNVAPENRLRVQREAAPVKPAPMRRGLRAGGLRRL